MADKIDMHLPQVVFFPHKDTSKDVRMMQHREQFGAEQNWVCPLSPILQIRRVPCPTILVSCGSAGAHELPLGFFHCSSKEIDQIYFFFVPRSRGKKFWA